MADYGTVILTAPPTPVLVTSFAVGAGLYYGTVVLDSGAAVPPIPTVPTTGQIWPRGNP